MAAYAALVSLMHIIDDIQHHHSPPISIRKHQSESLTQIIASLHEFLESHNTSEIDEADPLEMRIAEAAYEAEDIIESHIVNRINAKKAVVHQRARSVDAYEVSLTQSVATLQEFVDSGISRVTEFDEADPLERRIADAAYESEEDIIESHDQPARSVDAYKLSITQFLDSFESFDQFMASYQEFLQSRNTSSVTEFDEADSLQRRIADAAYESEDIIESHAVNRILPEDATHHDDQTNIQFSKAPAHYDDETNLYEDLKRVIDEMESIKKLTVQNNAEREVVHQRRLRPVDAFAAPSKSFSNRQNSIMVFPDDVVNEVKDKLTSDETKFLVIPIVGMGGIGKTTLAKNVYGQRVIKVHFDICAWATISQQYNAKEILCEVLCQATNATNEKREELSEKSEGELGDDLHKHLFGRRYLIVLDDMWTIDAWDRIQHFFPENNKGSRVLVTTRHSKLSSQLNKNYNHHMKFLDEGSSWDLFSKIVFGEESCPSELEGIGKKIVENCRGLPLSIVVVGGILKTKEYSQGGWESIEKNLTSVVNLENDKHCLRLLRMSYNHLPAHLKPCFLYMGVFEEDSEIKVSTLIKLWVCEGFLKPINNENLEAIGKGFLKDLVDRNLILVHELGSTGNVKYCKIHDLLRDLCLSESKKDGFYHVIEQDSPQGMDRQRRVVIPRNTSEKKVHDDLRSMSHVRSIISEYGKVPYCENFILVRALHAYKYRYYNDESYMNSDAFQYMNLRHLAIEVTSMSSFFSAITLHWNLHTLIVSCNQNSTAPVEIWKMPQFRRIEFVNTRLVLPDPPGDAVVMENLEVLKVVENFKFGEEAIKRIPNINKLGMRYSGFFGMLHEDYYCLTNIQELQKLESLHVSLWNDFLWVKSLNKLTFPKSLKKLTLSVTKDFEWDDMLEKTGSLPRLEKLQLWLGCFRTGEWEVVEGQFPSLKYLGIYACPTLGKLTTQDRIIFQNLEQLCLVHLEGLEEIPYEIGEIVTLQKISMMGCNASVVEYAKGIVEEQLESQDVLSFNVVVQLVGKNEELQSLAGPNFQVFP